MASRGGGGSARLPGVATCDAANDDDEEVDGGQRLCDSFVTLPSESGGGGGGSGESSSIGVTAPDWDGDVAEMLASNETARFRRNDPGRKSRLGFVVVVVLLWCWICNESVGCPPSPPSSSLLLLLLSLSLSSWLSVLYEPVVVMDERESVLLILLITSVFSEPNGGSMLPEASAASRESLVRSNAASSTDRISIV